MAKVSSGVKIVGYGEGTLDRHSIPVASAIVVMKGDLISLESNTTALLNAGAEDATFAGIAESSSATGETDDITVLKKCLVEVTVASATYDIGDGLAYAAGDADTLYTFAADAGANTIMHVAKQYDSNATTVLAWVDVDALGKLFTVDA